MNHQVNVDCCGVGYRAAMVHLVVLMGRSRWFSDRTVSGLFIGSGIAPLTALAMPVGIGYDCILQMIKYPQMNFYWSCRVSFIEVRDGRHTGNSGVHLEMGAGVEHQVHFSQYFPQNPV